MHCNREVHDILTFYLQVIFFCKHMHNMIAFDYLSVQQVTLFHLSWYSNLEFIIYNNEPYKLPNQITGQLI